MENWSCRGSRDQVVKIWATESGAVLATRFRPETFFSSGTFSPDSKTFYVVEGSRLIGWTVPGERQHAFAPPAGEVALTPSRDGSRAFSQNYDGWITIWNVDTGQRVPHAPILTTPLLQVSTPTLWFRNVPGTRVVGWNGKDAMLVIDAATGATIATIAATKPLTIEIDDSGRRALITGDGAPRLWDLEHGALISTLPFEHATGVSDDGHSVFAWTDVAHAVVWDIDAKQSRTRLELGAGATLVGFDKSGTRALFLEEGDYTIGASVSLYDLVSGTRLRRGTGFAPRFDASQTHVLLSADNRLQIWNASDGSTERSVSESESTVVTIDPTGEFGLAVGPQAIAVVSALDGRTLFRFDSADTVSLLSNGDDMSFLQTVLIWTASNQLVVANALHSAFWELSFEPRDADTLHALVASSAAFRVEDGKLVTRRGRLAGHVTMGKTLPTHVVATRVVSGAPYLATVGADGTFELGDLQFGLYSVNAGGQPTIVNVSSEVVPRAEIVAP